MKKSAQQKRRERAEKLPHIPLEEYTQRADLFLLIGGSRPKYKQGRLVEGVTVRRYEVSDSVADLTRWAAKRLRLSVSEFMREAILDKAFFILLDDPRAPVPVLRGR